MTAMAACIIDNSPTDTQFTPLVDLEAKLRAHALTLALAQPFTDLYEKEWLPLRDEETSLVVDQMRIAARAWFAGLSLDETLAALERVLRGAVKKDRKDPNYAFFFSKRRVSEIQRLGLDAKLQALEGWVEAVNGSPFPSVRALGPELAQRIATGEAARNELRAATEKLRQFRALGPRKAFNDKFNALRKSTAGKLAEMPFTMAEEKLPVTFADWFFLPARKPSAKPTSAQISAQIDQKKAEIEDLEQERQEALAREKAEAEARANEAQRMAELAALKKEKAALSAKEKSLKAPKRSRRSKK
jgi:hypothetical protein